MTELHRSFLFVPGSRPEFFDKAYASAVDAVVLDLEDAVAPSKKDSARQAVKELLSEPPPKPTFVRINPLESGLALADLEAVATTSIVAVRIAKCDSVEHVRHVGNALDEMGSAAGVQVLIESALGVERAFELAGAHPRVVGISLGEHDLRADLGATGDEALLYSRSRVVVAARAAGLLPPHQGTWPKLDDLDGLRESTRRGKQLGFFGRSALHPKQIDVINEVYTPTAEELAKAAELEDAMAAGIATDSGAVKLPDGSFVDSAVVLAAQRTLALGRRPSR